MRAATGPGKVTVFTQPASATGVGLSASLHNFDVDDATVKAEHRRFLGASVVGPLKADPQTIVSLRGTASQSGAADHNRALSERRVNAVGDFLVGRGVKKAQISMTFTGEDLSVSTLNEDEEERAVFVLLGSAEPLPGRARFVRANPADPSDGFHDGFRTFAEPVLPQTLLAFGVAGERSPAVLGFAPGFDEPKQIVVMGSEVAVLLTGGKGTVLTSNLELVAEVTRPARGKSVARDEEFIHIRGGVEGATDVVARDSSGTEFARMTVITVSKLERTVAFTFLRDAKGA